LTFSIARTISVTWADVKMPSGPSGATSAMSSGDNEPRGTAARSKNAKVVEVVADHVEVALGAHEPAGGAQKSGKFRRWRVFKRQRADQF